LKPRAELAELRAERRRRHLKRIETPHPVVHVTPVLAHLVAERRAAGVEVSAWTVKGGAR